MVGGGQIGGNLALLAAQKELGDVMIYDRKRNAKEKTLVRHIIYDLIFVTENAILAAYGYDLTIEPEHQSLKNWIIFWSLVSHAIGLLLKILY